ncbi:aminotransferase class I/II-fold pyridoxal phosphate-dependent enzyme, partial [Escherichia coli]|nr:aminotransferase class I/II-fold pyridoxal phosphate-dependent enzyme [Escherichia coli]
MTAALLSIVDAGDEVAIPNPCFPAYEACIRLAQGHPIGYRLPKDLGFGFDPEEFRRVISPRTKAAVIISPSNPTGRVLSTKNLEDIADILKDT